VSPRTAPIRRPLARGRPQVLIPHTLLITSGAFGPQLPAPRVADAIGRGVLAGGLPEPDLCPLIAAGLAAGARELLDELDFDSRMRRARAVIIADERLEEQTLAGSVTFEIATRARQGGVPAYAVSRVNALSAFDARMLDVQLILRAGSESALLAAGRRLAGLV
jgi:glycerate 2-kinase